MLDYVKPFFGKLTTFAKQRMGFDRPPRLFLRTDNENAQNPLGKTAFYDPSEMSVTLYISGRHPKDILRSLGHELVHHKQNCDGEFSDSDDMGPGYAQRDPHLRRMEQDANQRGDCVWDSACRGQPKHRSAPKWQSLLPTLLSGFRCSLDAGVIF